MALTKADIIAKLKELGESASGSALMRKTKAELESMLEVKMKATVEAVGNHLTIVAEQTVEETANGFSALPLWLKLLIIIVLGAFLMFLYAAFAE